MKTIMMPVALLAAGLAAGQAKGQPMADRTENGGVSMLLVLDAPPAQGQVRLRLEFENRGRQPALVPRAVASMDRLLGNVFIVKDALTGQPVPYVGPMVKRGPMTAADYLVLKPGQRHGHVIDIGPAYGFAAGEHAYEVSYAGHYVTDARALTGAGAAGKPLVAPPVTFSLAR
jgi:hypothetical protein